MLVLAYLALFGVPLMAALYVVANRGSARSVALAYVFGWLTMPLLRVELPALPSLDKDTLLPLSLLVATLVTHAGSPHLRPRWFDVPMVLFCLAPMVAALDNDLGLWDGLSQMERTFLTFGAPWIVGRVVFCSAGAVVELGRALLLGAALYAPLCLFESRMAPQLHLWVFGMPGRSGWETVGFYGPLQFKASVFLQSPLELTPLMGMAFLFGLWSWQRMRVRSVFGWSSPLLVGAALTSCLMGKSLGGVGLTVLATTVLWATRRTGSRVFIAALLSLAPIYIATRAAGLWDGMAFVDFIRDNVSERRSESFLTRVVNENMLVDKALQRPVFGWGGWGRSRVYDDEGRDISIVDGFWIIVLGTTGWLGLGSWLALMLMPIVWTWWRHWHVALRARGPEAILPCAMIVPAVHMIDCVPNAMSNPVYYLVAGGLATIASRVLVPDAVATAAPAGRPSRWRPLTQARRLGGALLRPRGDRRAT